MFLHSIPIHNETLVTEIVETDYRTASVFDKHGINYCCVGKISLQKACELNGIDIDLIKAELTAVAKTLHLSSSTEFDKWNLDFLIDYIQHIHHAYLLNNLPALSLRLEHFAQSHSHKYSWLQSLLSHFIDFKNKIFLHLRQEEEVFFPYIKQVAHAHASREPYASLLVKTMRKPIENIIAEEEEHLDFLRQFRKLTTNYTPARNSCVTHKVCLQKLKELDNDLVQHIHLEKDILFSKALAMEKEMLS